MEKGDRENLKKHKKNETSSLIYQKGKSEVYFSESYGSRKLLLFECPKELATEIENRSTDLRLVGDEKGEAVLCSSKHTYAIKKVETSNDCFVLPSSEGTSSLIESVHHCYYEVKSISHILKRLFNNITASFYCA